MKCPECGAEYGLATLVAVCRDRHRWQRVRQALAKEGFEFHSDHEWAGVVVLYDKGHEVWSGTPEDLVENLQK